MNIKLGRVYSALMAWMTLSQSLSHVTYQPVNEITYDLSYPYETKTVHWPNSRGFQFVKQVAQKDPSANWYAMNDFCVGEHAGTHLDAPYHFNQLGWKVGDIPITKLINRAYVLDVETVSHNATTVNTMLLPQHIQQFEKKLFGEGGTLPELSILLIRFNWSQFYGTPEYYNVVTDERGDSLSFPGISAAVAKLLVVRKIAGLGVDTPSVDAGTSTTFDTHRILAHANIFSIENLKIPRELMDHTHNLIVYVMPMNILEGTGAPARVIAVIPNKCDKVTRRHANGDNLQKSSGKTHNAHILTICFVVLSVIMLN